MKPLVSVVIATRDRAALLAQTLDALARQTRPHDRLEILIADNGSTDGTRATVEAAAARPDMPAVSFCWISCSISSRLFVAITITLTLPKNESRGPNRGTRLRTSMFALASSGWRQSKPASM